MIMAPFAEIYFFPRFHNLMNALVGPMNFFKILLVIGYLLCTIIKTLSYNVNMFCENYVKKFKKLYK